MTKTSIAGLSGGNKGLTPEIPLSVRATRAIPMLGPATNAASIRRLGAIPILGPAPDRVSISRVRAAMTVDSRVDYPRAIIHQSFKPTGYRYGDKNDFIENRTAGSNYLQWCVTNEIIPADSNTYYFEVLCITPTAYMDGYIGVTQDSLVAANYNAGTNPLAGGQIAFRGTGNIWSDNSQVVTIGQNWGYGAWNNIARIAFNATTGEIWVGNGTQWHRNPDTQSASYVITPMYRGVDYRGTLQCRNPNDALQLLGRVGDFRFPLPSSCVPLKS